MTTHRPPGDDLPRPYPYRRPASTPPTLDAAREARKATFRRDLGTLRAFFDECETVPESVHRCPEPMPKATASGATPGAFRAAVEVFRLWHAAQIAAAPPANRSARAHQELAVGTAVQRVARHPVIAGGVHSPLRNAGPEIKLRDATLAPITPPNSDSSAGMIGLLHRTRFWVTLLLRLIGSLTVLGRAGDACRALPDRFPRLADYVMLIGIKCGDRRRTPQTTRSSQP